MRTDAKEFREFLRTVCIVSATMASMSFVGVSIIISIYPPSAVTGAGAWRNVAYLGVVAVFGFSATSIAALIWLDPTLKGLKTKREREMTHKGIWVLILVSWFSFLALIAGLLITFMKP